MIVLTIQQNGLDRFSLHGQKVFVRIVWVFIFGGPNIVLLVVEVWVGALVVTWIWGLTWFLGNLKVHVVQEGNQKLLRSGIQVLLAVLHLYDLLGITGRRAQEARRLGARPFSLWVQREVVAVCLGFQNKVVAVNVIFHFAVPVVVYGLLNLKDLLFVEVFNIHYAWTNHVPFGGNFFLHTDFIGFLLLFDFFVVIVLSLWVLNDFCLFRSVIFRFYLKRITECFVQFFLLFNW